MRLRLKILILLSCILFASCSSGLRPDEYMRYFEKNRAKFSVTTERNGLIATITCLPREYYAACTMTFDTAITLNQAMEPYKNSFFILIEVARDTKRTDTAKAVPSGIGKAEIFITAGSDTLNPNGVRPEKNWRFATSNSVVAAFNYNRVMAKGPKKVLYVRNMYAELGTIEFPLKKIQKRARSLKG